jgi:hypothetical protein
LGPLGNNLGELANTSAKCICTYSVNNNLSKINFVSYPPRRTWTKILTSSTWSMQGNASISTGRQSLEYLDPTD